MLAVWLSTLVTHGPPFHIWQLSSISEWTHVAVRYAEVASVTPRLVSVTALYRTCHTRQPQLTKRSWLGRASFDENSRSPGHEVAAFLHQLARDHFLNERKFPCAGEFPLRPISPFRRSRKPACTQARIAVARSAGPAEGGPEKIWASSVRRRPADCRRLPNIER